MCSLYCPALILQHFSLCMPLFFNEFTVRGSDIRAVGQTLDSPLSLRDSISFGCTVYAGESIEVQPFVSWTMPNGQEPEQQTDTYFAPVNGHVTGIAQSTLHIQSLAVSDAGRYQCASSISVPRRESITFVDVKIQREDGIYYVQYIQ